MSVHLGEFLIDVKQQREWGWLVINYLFLGGAGAGLFLASLYLGQPWGEGVGLVLLLLSLGFLFLDLGRPERFWRAFLRPQTSWISRGSISIGALVLLGGLHILAQSVSAEMGALQTGLAIAAAAAAIAVMAYTGFLLAPSPAIPFWNSAFFPAIFFAYSLLAGIDILILVSPVLPGTVIDLHLVESVQLGLVLVCLLMVLSHLSVMSHSTVAARRSIQALTHGRLGWLFLGGVIGAGLIVPFLAVGTTLWVTGSPTIAGFTVILALLRLSGDYVFRFLVIHNGYYDSLL